MPVKLEDYVARLPAADVRAIEGRAAELVQEEANLRQLREQVGARSQAEIARRLKINQASVSKLERRTDMYVKTLSRLIRAMGGELEIVARFPGKAPVRITQFRELTEP
jgi:transcriptional regulator with XRE-family HTH domain